MINTESTKKATGWKGKILRFLTAQTISLFGSSLVQYAIIWHITLSTSSGAMLTLSTLCGFAPQILISLFAGVWIDRYHRKRMILLADGLIAVSTLLSALLFLAGHRSVWLLLAVLLIRSAGTGIQTPAVSALIPQLVPKEKLMRVNGVNSTISSLMMFLSPAISGAILSVSSIETTFFIDAATALIGIGITAFISIPTRARAEVEMNTARQSIKQGFSYLRENGFVKRLLLFQIVLLILISPAAFLTPLMVSRTFGAEVWRLTASEMVFSAGAMLGGVLIAAWGGFRSRMYTAALAGAVYGLLMIGLGAAPVFPVYLACNLLIGVTMPCYNSPLTVLIQEEVEPALHGRVFGMMQISTSCALPLGMLLFGPLADRIPVQWILIGAGALVMLCALLFLRKMQAAR